MSLKMSSRKSLFSLLVAGLVLLSMNISDAQVLSGIPSCGNVDLGPVKIVPFAQVGYKCVGFNFNLPYDLFPSSRNGGTYGPPALDLSFRNASVWMGSIGFEALTVSRLFLSLRADGNATKNIDVITGQNFPWFARPTPFTWNGSQVQWWDVDGMVGYSFFKDWSVVVGLRYDYLTVGMGNPVDAMGIPINSLGNHQNTGDVTVKTWIPYIGLQLNETKYKALLLYTPFASTQVNVPEPVVNIQPTFIENSIFLWQFSKTGSFLEGYFEYNVPVQQSLQFGCWARGTWMSFKGAGSWSLTGTYTAVLINETMSDSSNGGLSTYGLAGGVTASLVF